MQRLFVANWKMNKSFSQAVEFTKHNLEPLTELAAKPGCTIVLCPSFPSLFTLADICAPTMINIGAQNCSAYEKGSFTGQVSAQSLKDVGCCYCIVGHSEQRQYCGETNEEVAQKVGRLFEQNIEPIICIGESKEQYEKNKVFEILTAQLNPIFTIIAEYEKPFTIAYEPIWAIGTGIIPQKEYLQDVYTWLSNQVQNNVSHKNWNLLYGGSVDESNVSELKSIKGVGGFLIGGASLDFQKFQKIVSLAC